MSISPVDIKKMGFKSSMMGFNKVDVQAYLEVLSDEFTKLLTENENLKKDIIHLTAKVEDQEKIKLSLENAANIITNTVGDIKIKAEKEAELLINKAKLKAEEIVSSAHNSNIEIVDKIDALLKEKFLIIKKIENSIDIHY